MATFETEGFSMALEKIATDSAESAYIPIADLEVTYDDDTTSNKSTKLPQLLVQVKIFL